MSRCPEVSKKRNLKQKSIFVMFSYYAKKLLAVLLMGSLLFASKFVFRRNLPCLSAGSCS
jgi:hypothetical protein